VAVAGWEGAVVVVEMTTLEKKFVQSYQIDGGNGQLVISSVAHGFGRAAGFIPPRI